MKRNSILPAFIVGATAAVVVAMSGPYWMRAQDAPAKDRALPAGSGSLGGLPGVIAPFGLGQTTTTTTTTTTATTTLTLGTLNDGAVNWIVPSSPNSTQPFQLTSQNLTVPIVGVTSSTKPPTLTVKGAPVTFNTAANSFNVALGVNEKAVPIAVVDGSGNPLPVFYVSTPASATTAGPTIRDLCSQKFFDQFAALPATATPPTTIYGRELRVHYQLPSPTLKLTPVLFQIDTGGTTPILFGAQPTILKDDGQVLKFELPTGVYASTTYQLRFRQDDPNKNYVYSAAFPITLTIVNNPVAPPTLTTVSKVDGATTTNLTPDATKAPQSFNTNATSLNFAGNDSIVTGTGVVLFNAGTDAPASGAVVNGTSSGWTVLISGISTGPLRYEAANVSGETIISSRSKVITIKDVQSPPQVLNVSPMNFASTPASNLIRVQFDPDHPIDATSLTVSQFTLVQKSISSQPPTPTLQPLDTTTNTVILDYGTNPIPIGTYTFTVSAGVKDIFGNVLQNPAVFTIVKPDGSDLPLVAPGISASTGPYVPYKEFTPPRKNPNGFNPGDHVETRVVRLYYFRDAHRVAQILNRTAKSYNRVAVDTRRRLAESARGVADDQTLNRKVAERDAVQAAQSTRAAQQNFQKAQSDFVQATAALNSANTTLGTDGKPDPTQVANAQTQVQNATLNINTTQQALISAQADEVTKRNIFQTASDKEDQLRATQFRLEVAAMHEDPDTYAPGVPKSNDPVQQVSISVLGASEIHLRGPISGINIIRDMVNQIDAPTGQVRVAIHTVQVNGERQEKMEKVVGEIQTYIDHARFLTQQSSLMLRKAILKVASRKAWEASMQFPGDTQEARDQRYLYSFFGKDFINELRVQQSEFLRTSNKLLSLNSMDTTSLASALFVLALAKNETRMEVLREFKEMLGGPLAAAEQAYYDAAGPRNVSCWKNCWPCSKPQCDIPMAQNARFQSFLGFFDAEVIGDDLLTPPQREFVRLAQIMKSRLVTELEYKQRISERALVEDRMANYQQDLKDAAAQEAAAKTALATSQQSLRQQQTNVLQVTAKVNAIFKNVTGQFDPALTSRLEHLLASLPSDLGASVHAYANNTLVRAAPAPANPFTVKLLMSDGTAKQIQVTATSANNQLTVTLVNDADVATAQAWLNDYKAMVNKVYGPLQSINYDPEQLPSFNELGQLLQQFTTEMSKFATTKSANVSEMGRIVALERALDNHVLSIANTLMYQFSQVTFNLSKATPDLQSAYRLWLDIRAGRKYLVDTSVVDPVISDMDAGFTSLFQAEANRRIATETADRSRRPLDQKKLLDMLIDDIQDKYVELLEGTRAYTANIDDYIKRLATALDDDFNTQFYLPAFRQIRTAATSWDVTLGAIETTSILTNNRTYAKVDPQATMEFDLPRRNIVITEAFQGAKGLLDTYGALTQDPTFLNLVRISGGMPTSSQSVGQSAGVNSIRSVLPGLPGADDESLLAQNGSGAKSFGTPLDALVPDPAIYKFETGTAYEIRPIIQPDGQSVNFHFQYMYTINVREPVRADEKHLGRVKRHYIDTDVTLGNYELREISKYQVALRASRTGKGVPLLQDIPGLGVLFRPLPSAESSLQQNVILGQSTIFPTLFDLMGLRWAPAVADLDPLALTNADFVVRQRKQYLYNRVFDYSSSKVDEALQIPDGERRGDLYRSQQTIPYVHPNGYKGPGMGLRDSYLREGYDPKQAYPESQYIPGQSREGHLNPYNDAQKRRFENPRMSPGTMMPGLPGTVDMVIPKGGPMLPTPMVPIFPPNQGMPMPIPNGGVPGAPWTPPSPVPYSKAPPARVPLQIPATKPYDGSTKPQSFDSTRPVGDNATYRMSSANLNSTETVRGGASVAPTTEIVWRRKRDDSD